MADGELRRNDYRVDRSPAGKREGWRARRKRQRREELERQVAAGTLVIRQATAEERERYGIRASTGGDDA